MAKEGELNSKLSADMAESPPNKKQKVSLDVKKSIDRRIKDFKITEVLNEDAKSKAIFLGGSYDNLPGDAVVILEREPFREESVREIFGEGTEVEETLQNDIYSTAKIFPPVSCNAMKATVIYPATANHLDKYRFQPTFMLNETPEDYRLITLPYIQSTLYNKSGGFSLQWVHNILDKKAELEKIVYEDSDPSSGFILLPDMKWNGTQVRTLHLVAIVNDRSLRTIRDLSDKNLVLLENIRNRGRAAIMKRYDISDDQLLAYFHYQPSYYHLHVHFTHVDYDGPGRSVGKAHLLDDVIDNILLVGDYYQRKTLSFYINKGHVLQCQFSQRDKSNA